MENNYGMNGQIFFKYLNMVTNYLERNYGDKLISIILFGSLIDEDERIIISSDVDLIIITNDSSSLNDFQTMKQSLFKLENNFLSHLRIRESAFIRGLQRATGMFCNFFICRVSDFKDRNFTKVFNINSIMGGFLAPQNSVWLSLLRQHRIIWGEDVFKEWKTLPRITRCDLIQSFLMNSLLAIGALFLFPFHSQIAKFSMEAMKWSLFTWRNFSNLSLLTLAQICTEFAEAASIMELRALHSFMEYRKNKTSGNYFALLALIFVFLIHRSLLRHSYG